MRAFLLLFLLAGCTSRRVFEELPQRETLYSTQAPCKIVIDAGHGGKDFGAQSHGSSKSQEKVLTLATGLFLNDALERMGYQTILTRGEDFFVPLKLRAEFANGNRAALFISVHYNAASNKEAEGVEVYYYPSETMQERTAESKVLAETVLRHLISDTSMKSRGVKKGDFAVIRETKMPAILVEGGFLTNEKEANRLRDPQVQKTIAESIASGIHEYLHSASKRSKRPRRDSNARPAA